MNLEQVILALEVNAKGSALANHSITVCMNCNGTVLFNGTVTELIAHYYEKNHVFGNAYAKNYGVSFFGNVAYTMVQEEWLIYNRPLEIRVF